MVGTLQKSATQVQRTLSEVIAENQCNMRYGCGEEHAKAGFPQNTLAPDQAQVNTSTMDR